RRRSSNIRSLPGLNCRGRSRLRGCTRRLDFRLGLLACGTWRIHVRRRLRLMDGRPPASSLLPGAGRMAGLTLRTPGRHPRRLRNGAKDNLNLNLVHIFVAQFNDLVKSFLPNVRLGLPKSQMLALDHRTSYRPRARSVTLDTFLERNIKKENHARNLKPLCQFQIFLPMVLSERGGIHHTEPVQAQAQFREVVDESERLGLKTLIPLVVAHSSSRPVRRDDWVGRKRRRAKVDFPQAAGPQSKTIDGRISLTLFSLLSLGVCSWVIVVMTVHFKIWLLVSTDP